MDQDELLRENRALRDRLSRLSEASLRINESLDFDTVLQEVLDSACALTEAQYGVLAHFDETGDAQAAGALTFGLTPAQAEAMWEMLTGSEFCAFFEQLPGPTRLRDLAGHFAAQGLPGFRLAIPVDPPISFLGVVLRRGGEPIGAIYLGVKKSGPEFTEEDEETLLMFAAQAALVIANARQHQDEQKARADLETLVETSPVGVVVLDAGTGLPLSFNRETTLIITGLGVTADDIDNIDELLGRLYVRRADGREYCLGDFSLAETLRIGETVRAEEVVIGLAEGPSVPVLVNATPIRSDTGEIETYVVTLQDMTPLAELERLRAEFLGMVSHELRTPLSTIRGSITTLIDDVTALHPAEMHQFFRIILEQADRMRALIADLLDVARIETGTLSVSPEPMDIAFLVGEARNGFRGGGGQHDIEVDLPPGLPWVMGDRVRMVQVLGNLLINAARHSPAASPIRVTGVRQGVHVAVSVSDEGRGIPAESLPHLFRKFSRIDADDQGGDTGLGLAVCKGIVEAHGGRIWAESDGPGLGARFTFTIPTVEESGYVSPAASAQPAARSAGRRAEQVRILVVDDDSQALRYARDAVSQAGYQPVATTDPDEALRLLVEVRPQLVLLDLVLPGSDGIDLMQEMVRTVDVPVIFLSAYGQDQLVARAFDKGAADYVVKPFSPTELAARIRAALRRRETPDPQQPFVLGDLAIDYTSRRVTLAGAAVPLTAIEFRTLAELSANAGQVLTYEHLLRRVWGLDYDADLRPMRTVISSLRRKLGDDAENPNYIFTELRVGYRMPRGVAQMEEPGSSALR